MKYLRYDNRNTNLNAYTLETLINDKNTQKVILFSSINDGNKMSSTDGPNTNLPLLAALVEYSIAPNALDISIVFDGAFLTAARLPRYSEVQLILDLSEKKTNVYYSKDRVDFTSKLSPEGAAKVMLGHSNLENLTKATRKSFFRLLSSVSEQQLKNMR